MECNGFEHPICITLSSNEAYHDLSVPVAVPSQYVVGEGWRTLRADTVEITDDELVQLVQQSGAFDFLDDPKEDIYSLSDGEPIC